MSFVLRSRLSSTFREVKHCFLTTNTRRCSAKPSHTNVKRSPLKGILIGVGFGVAAGGLYSYYSLDQNNNRSVLSTSTISKVSTLKALPSVQISRKIVNPKDTSGLDITLFQYPTCPFCCKVRAFLDYHGISYNVIEVNPVLRQQLKWSQYKKVPIILIKDKDEYVQLNDSSMIISALSTYLRNSSSSVQEVTEYYPTLSDNISKVDVIANKYFVMNAKVDKKQIDTDKDERQWREWADNVLVHTLSPNVYRTKDEAIQAFSWFSEVGEWDRLFSKWEQVLIVYVGAYAMWMIGRKLKKKYNLKENVRESLYDECRVWTKEVKKRGKFFGGSTPDLADLAVYGVLSSIEGCDAFRELLENTNVGNWFNDMKQAVQSHRGNVVTI